MVFISFAFFIILNVQDNFKIRLINLSIAHVITYRNVFYVFVYFICFKWSINLMFTAKIYRKWINKGGIYFFQSKVISKSIRPKSMSTYVEYQHKIINHTLVNFCDFFLLFFSFWREWGRLVDKTPIASFTNLNSWLRGRNKANYIIK